MFSIDRKIKFQPIKYIYVTVEIHDLSSACFFLFDFHERENITILLDSLHKIIISGIAFILQSSVLSIVDRQSIEHRHLFDRLHCMCIKE